MARCRVCGGKGVRLVGGFGFLVWEKLRLVGWGPLCLSCGGSGRVQHEEEPDQRAVETRLAQEWDVGGEG